jgi:hypothetical protein
MTRLIMLIGLLTFITLGGCDFMSHTRCDDKIVAQEKSPDGKYVAVLYHRSCANNTGLYTWASLQDISGIPSSQNEAVPILTITGFHEIGANWIGPNALEIRSEGINDQKAILSQENTWKGIRIFYKG